VGSEQKCKVLTSTTMILILSYRKPVTVPLSPYTKLANLQSADSPASFYQISLTGYPKSSSAWFSIASAST